MGYMSKNIGFVSTRFSGTDGVTLEASKWADVFTKNGHNCFWFAGKLDRDMEKSLLVPEAYFQHEKNQWINEQILGKKRRNPSVMGRDHRHAELAAIFDALLQDPLHHHKISNSVVSILKDSCDKRKEEVSKKSAATKVDFFTMVRGE